jgi:tetratricopeptide (TPR) repeat protein
MSKGFLTSHGVIVAALSLSLVGCGQFGKLKASKHFKDANALYAQQDYRGAAAEYKAAIEADPSLHKAYFFLANSYDNLFKPARKGNELNDSYLHDALKNYKIAAEKLVEQDEETKLLRKRTLQFMAALYAKDKLNQPDEAEPVVKQLIAMEPNDPGAYFALVRIYEDAGKVDDAEEILKQAQAASPDKVEVWSNSALFYNRQGEFEKAIESFQRITQIEPKNPQNYYQIAQFCEEKVRKDFTLKTPQQAQYLAKGLEAVDKALELRPDYFEALTYKNLLLRQQAAKVEKNPKKQQELLKQAEAVYEKALEVQKAQRGAPAAAPAAGAK